MTVLDTPASTTFVGDAVQTSFSFVFRVDDASWVSVDYTTNLDQILLNGDQDANPGGSVDYLAAPPSGQLINVVRQVPLTQLLDYTRYDPFDSESHEDALDKLTMALQDRNRTTAGKSKSITVESPTTTENISMFYTPVEITVSGVESVLQGSGPPSLSWGVRFSNTRTNIGTELKTGGFVTTSTTTGDTETDFDNPVIPADSFVWIITTTASGALGSFHATIRYTEELP